MKALEFEEKKRFFEFVLIIFTTGLLIALSRLETRLFSLSESLAENREFFTTIVYFALININVILILFLSFLIFRNVTKLIVEKRSGILGTRLKTKLIIALVFFALAPTILLFYVSMQFLTTSFETWFSEKVHVIMQQTREAGSQVYKQDQKRLQSLARIGLERIELHRNAEEPFDSEKITIKSSRLEGFDTDYGLSSVKVYKPSGRQIWSNSRGSGNQIPEKPDEYVDDALALFKKDSKFSVDSRVVSFGNQDVVKGAAAIRDPENGNFLGAVITEVRFESQILKSIEKILADFANLKPGAQLIRLSYVILMIVMVLLIVFSAIWLGFYVARKITEPLLLLAGATREIAVGNYEVNIKQITYDETGQLVQAFNSMARELRLQQQKTEEAKRSLQHTNEELEQRRQYMEIVLKNITTGVLSLDSHHHVTSINSSAERLLGLDGGRVVGNHIKIGIGEYFYEQWWLPILEGLSKKSGFQGEIELNNTGYQIIFLVHATRIRDENNVEVGFVIVFDDATQQVRAQKVAAWREVARRIAHEIKNPITPIKLNAQRLLRRYKDHFTGENSEVFRTCIEAILTQVDSLRDLVNEFSKFSRLPKIHAMQMSLNDIVLEAVTFFQMSYPEIHFATDGIKEIPLLYLDKEQINRVMINLLTNSIDALVEGRKASISVATKYFEELKIVRFSITDNGCGIAKEIRDRVIEPYFSTKDEGTGLGLAIVQQIISDHRGYLRIVENKPSGTTVIVEFPLEGETKKFEAKSTVKDRGVV